MRVVAVGGGHGTAVSLRALRRVSDDVTGVVSVADDGGSTGRLRAMLNVAAVGDLRKCLGALADPAEPARPPPSSTASASGELNGHAVGNLLLVGLIDATGDLEESVRAVAQVMGVTGAIVPASQEGVVLVASTEEGDTRGQSEVMKSSTIRRIRVEPTNAATPIAAVEAIERADVILIGPGSLFTSVLAACVVPGVTQALAGHERRRRSTSRTCTSRSPRPRATRSRTTWTRWCVTASCPNVVLVDQSLGVRAAAMFTPRSHCGPRGAKWHGPRCAKIDRSGTRRSAITTPTTRGAVVAIRVAINGFGRIGRGYLRASLSNPDIDVVAVNDLDLAGGQRPPPALRLDPGQPRRPGRAHERRHDRGHQDHQGPRRAQPRRTARGANSNVDVVIESTGRFTTRESAAQHLSGRRAQGHHLGAGDRRRRDVRDRRERGHLRPGQRTTSSRTPRARRTASCRW